MIEDVRKVKPEYKIIGPLIFYLAGLMIVVAENVPEFEQNETEKKWKIFSI